MVGCKNLLSIISHLNSLCILPNISRLTRPFIDLEVNGIKDVSTSVMFTIMYM